MTVQVAAEKREGETGHFDIDNAPDLCPVCHISVSPRLIWAAFIEDPPFSPRLQIVYRCPRQKCDSLFIAYYSRRDLSGASRSTIFYFDYSAPVRLNGIEFSEEIQDASPTFVEIYNQAIAAESHQLDQLAGMGLRKALEFLIKDFLIKRRPADAESIKKAMLGVCINNYVDDPKLKKCAERATWLGNDETHYERKYVGQDISDLKVLIRLTVNWVESELLTEKYGTVITKK
jgi:hypothetical protein